MRKEVLVAIILGVGLGVAVAFGIWRANQAFSAKKQVSQAEAPVASPGTQNFSELVLTQPENNAVVAESLITIKGATTPKATIVILAESNEYILEAGSDGSFEEEIILNPGPNEIKVTSYGEYRNEPHYGEDGTESQEKLVIIYTTELTTE